MTVVGELSLWVALFLAVWASAASIAGSRLGRPELVASSTRAVRASAAMTALACVGVWVALLSHDFSLRYVASYTTLNTPPFYLTTAFWAGPEGRVTFLALACAVGAVVVLRSGRDLAAPTRIAVAAVLSTLLALLLIIVCFAINPYDRLEWIPAEGQGLDPQLQTPYAMPFFVATYAGYGAASVGLALSVAAARAARTDARWRGAMRRWCVACWCLLTVAIALRMRWSYLEPAAEGFPALDRAQWTTLLVWGMTLALVIALRRRETTIGSARRRRSLVGWLALALGLLLVVIGIAASRVWTDRSVSLRPGESAELRDRFGGEWRFMSQGVSRDEQVNHLSTSVALEAARDGRRVGFVTAERRQYIDSVQRPTFEVAVKPGVTVTARQDVYVVLSGLRADAADLRIGFRPLISLVWAGWLLVFAGGLLLAAAPARHAVVATG